MLVADLLMLWRYCDCRLPIHCRSGGLQRRDHCIVVLQCSCLWRSVIKKASAKAHAKVDPAFPLMVQSESSEVNSWLRTDSQSLVTFI